MEGAELPAQHDFQIPSELAPEPLPLYLAHTRRPAAERRLVLDFAHHRNMFAVLIGAFVAGALISLMANGAQRQIEWRGQLAFFAPAQQPYYAQTKEGSAKKAGNPSEPSVTALPLRSTIVVARPAGGNQTRPRAQTSAASEKSKDIPAAAALKALPGPAASQAANPVAEADSPTPPVQQTNAVTPSEQPEAVAPATATQRTT